MSSPMKHTASNPAASSATTVPLSVATGGRSSTDIFPGWAANPEPGDLAGGEIVGPGGVLGSLPVVQGGGQTLALDDHAVGSGGLGLVSGRRQGGSPRRRRGRDIDGVRAAPGALHAVQARPARFPPLPPDGTSGRPRDGPTPLPPGRTATTGGPGGGPSPGRPRPGRSPRRSAPGSRRSPGGRPRTAGVPTTGPDPYSGRPGWSAHAGPQALPARSGPITSTRLAFVRAVAGIGALAGGGAVGLMLAEVSPVVTAKASASRRYPGVTM